ncbi:nucleotide-diphosphate-sugar epimerase [Sphaerisporangium melleum]|uniref:Nucleotide-diphosphate-sugar epimerase n=1 Tax=Sphaerisporangium melleum TaxID=321316 RepID=A0A917QQD4_9ACTN|nr:NAD(P)H-binding protein [Sphaerisporangium melleum]GGK62902.1 nucleotide-diphosphate-sugar epimerase [Sphaerisporangium melleum]GII68022.1 nucleotide-diphosphate-sugar epimerase [Sphaerisporangium melleum]
MILVTGATGRVGRHAVAGLLEAGAEVRALARDPEAATLPDGAEVVRGDLSRPETLDAALAGVEAVFLVWPTLSADHAAPAVAGAIAERARHIVYLSARGVSPQAEAQGGILGSHALLERLIEESGVEWTFLRPGGFAANTLMWAPQIRQSGVVRWVHGAASRPLIHERDIAAVGVRALTGPGHAGARYELTGPQTLTQIEQVSLIGEAVGRPVRWEEMAPEAALQAMVEQGLPASAARGILDAHAALVTAPEPVTGTVERITGAPATPFRQWAADHAADFR